jgi:Mg-chelatase subunit ChlD
MDNSIALIKELRSLPGKGISNTQQCLPGVRDQRTVFALDFSASMNRRDMEGSRRSAAIAATEEYISARAGLGTRDIFGCVVFASRAKNICSHTSSEKAHRDIISRLRSSKFTGATDIARGLRAASAILPARDPQYDQCVVVLSDGHGGDSTHIASQLRNRGVTIWCVGIGGSPEDVDEKNLIKTASVIDGKSCYRFIRDRASLVSHFKELATSLVRTQ